MDAQPRLLQPTRLLDFAHPIIEALVEKRGWRQLPMYERIGAVYDFVRNEIAFGYNEGDELPASTVLADGIGQCNTKSTLLMALLRAVGVPCRFHGFTIDKPLQKGAITGPAYALAPQRIIHSWVEVSFEGRWVSLGRLHSGHALPGQPAATVPWPEALLRLRCSHTRPVCAWGRVARPGHLHPERRDRDDFGVFDSPDGFYALHGSNLSGLKRWLYMHVIRHRMNAQVRRIRAEKW